MASRTVKINLSHGSGRGFCSRKSRQTSVLRGVQPTHTDFMAILLLEEIDMNKYLLVSLTLLTMCLAACTPGTPQAQPTTTAPSQAEPVTLSIMTHDSFAASEEVIRQFETENNAKVQFLFSGDTGTALNRAILAGDAPLADVFYGVDNTFLSRALEENIFEAYESPLLAEISDEFKLDGQNRALPVDYGDVCLNYDIAYFEQAGIEPPQSLADLLLPEYRGLLVVQNPATSSPGLSFMLATIAVFGEEGYLDYWQRLMENDLLVVNSWETAYYTEFSGSAGRGPRPIVVSYGSSPPFEVIYAETPIDEPPTAAVTNDDTCFRQIEFVGILRGGNNRALAEKWVDFMLSPVFQADMPLQMFVFPVNPNAELDETFVKYLSVPERPVQLDPADIANNRERWIQEWTQTILR
jgi:thiamine transport system substrate-binding protein